MRHPRRTEESGLLGFPIDVLMYKKMDGWKMGVCVHRVYFSSSSSFRRAWKGKKTPLIKSGLTDSESALVSMHVYLYLDPSCPSSSSSPLYIQPSVLLLLLGKRDLAHASTNPPSSSVKIAKAFKPRCESSTIHPPSCSWINVLPQVNVNAKLPVSPALTTRTLPDHRWQTQGELTLA